MKEGNDSPDLNPTAPALDTIKARMKVTWEDGNYTKFATYMEAGAEEILRDWKIAPGQRLLDIGCGAGQSAIPAARTGLYVTGVDIAENLIEDARARAATEGLEARFDVGDAEDLPYDSGSFDVIISMIGAMFAPRPDRVAAELARVLTPGGKLHMANWTPDGMPAQMFKCIASFVPPPPGAIPPVLWGDEDTVRSRLEENFDEIQMIRKNYPRWHYPFSASELVGLFRTHFGPVKRAFEAIDAESRTQLFHQLEEIYTSHGETVDGEITITKGEYLEVIATRR